MVIVCSVASVAVGVWACFFSLSRASQRYNKRPVLLAESLEVAPTVGLNARDEIEEVVDAWMLLVAATLEAKAFVGNWTKARVVAEADLYRFVYWVWSTTDPAFKLFLAGCQWYRSRFMCPSTDAGG